MQIFLKIILEFYKIFQIFLKIHSNFLRKFYWQCFNICFCKFFKIKILFYCPIFTPSRSKVWLRPWCVQSSVASGYSYKLHSVWLFVEFPLCKFFNYSFWNCIGACECVLRDCGYVLRRWCMCAPQSVSLIKSSCEFAWGVASLNKSCVNCVWAWKICITTIHSSVPCASGTQMSIYQ